MNTADPTLYPTLHYHPLSSYCQKVLIAIDELDVPVQRQLLNLGDPAEREAHLARWPTGKMPLLMDGGQPVAESSIIVEHLQCHHAAVGRVLIPDAVDDALQVRLWDRLFDQYVMTPMQRLTGDLLRQPPERDPHGVAQARAALSTAYDFIDRHLASQSQGHGRTQNWAVGADFTLADCAAMPALFYAATYVPLPATHTHLVGYFERLLQRPSVARVLDEARPYFRYYPNRAGLDLRFHDPAQG